MSTLENLAKRIGEISEEIKTLNAVRDINIQHCHGSGDKNFDSAINKELYDNCMTVAYQWSKEEREESANDSECGYAPWGSYSEFKDILNIYGCKNCKAAYKAKRDIGKLKQERGRLVGNISKIGKTL